MAAPQPSSRAVVCAAVGAGVLTALLRLTAFNGFENDHFMHLAWAQQLALGALPGRDFVEPGMPLAIVLSALAQWLWPGSLSEAVLGTACLGVAGGFLCAVTARLTRSLGLGLLASAVALVLYPRLYSYPKLLVPAVALWLLRRYVQNRSTRRLWHLAIWSVVAFLLRHDLGVMAAVAMLVGLLVDAEPPFGARVRSGARFVGMGLFLVAPYLAYLQWAEGIGEHIRVGNEFGKAEQHQVFWTGPSLTAGPDERSLVVGAWLLSAEAILFWLFTALTFALVWWVLRIYRRPYGAVVAALLVFAVAYRFVILRYPLRARLPDVAGVAAVGVALATHATFATAARLRVRRPAAALALGSGWLAVSIAAGVSLWTVVNLGDRISQAGFERGPMGVAITLRDVLRRWDDRSWHPYWPAGDLPPAIDYLARCTTRQDRLLVTWFAPEYYVFSGRGFAAGHAMFLPASFATEGDQAHMLERLAQESLPVVLINETEHAGFTRAFPRVAAYLASRYTVRTRFHHNDDTIIGVAIRNDLEPPVLAGDAPWGCRSVARSAAVSGS